MLQSEIVGTVKMRCYLTGMPELRLGLNDKILFESTGRKWNHPVFLFSIELASVTFSAHYIHIQIISQTGLQGCHQDFKLLGICND